MNFLALAQAVKRESGLSGVGPSSYVGAVGDDLRIFNWVNWAARDITLSREDWRFRRGTATLPSTTAQSNPSSAWTDTATGLAVANFAQWKPANRVYKPSGYRVSDGLGAEHELTWVDYDRFRKMFYQGVQASNTIQYWSIAPDESFLIGPTPDSAHFLRADFIKDYVDLAADGDTPLIPARFHMLIVWRALKEYAGFDAATEVYQRADSNYNLMWPQLTQAQMEMPINVARGLA